MAAVKVDVTPTERVPRARTCVSCRARKDPAALLWLGWVPETGLRVGPWQRSGRGAWVCLSLPCLQGLRPKGLARALRVSEIPQRALRELPGAARTHLDQELQGLLARCARAGLVESGAARAQQALTSGQAVALVWATDASPQTIQALQAGDHVPHGVIGLDRAALGGLLGRGPRAVLAVRGGRPATPLACRLRCRQALG